MKRTQATEEHLIKQIAFYTQEEDRVSRQLIEIQDRLRSDTYVLELIEAEKKRDAANSMVRAGDFSIMEEPAYPTTLPHTGTQDNSVSTLGGTRDDEYDGNKKQKVGKI